MDPDTLTTTVDHLGFPHILDSIVDYAPHEVLLSFRAVSRYFQRRADALLFKHIMIRTPDDDDHLVAANGDNLPGRPWHLVKASSPAQQLWHTRLGNTRIIDETSFQTCRVQRISRGYGPPLPPHMVLQPPIHIYQPPIVLTHDFLTQAAAVINQMSPPESDALQQLLNQLSRRAEMEARIVDDLPNVQVRRHVPGTLFRTLEISAPHLITFVPCTPSNLRYPVLSVVPPRGTKRWTISILWHPTQFSLKGANFQPSGTSSEFEEIEEIVLLFHQMASPIFPVSGSLPDDKTFPDPRYILLFLLRDSHYLTRRPTITVVGLDAFYYFFIEKGGSDSTEAFEYHFPNGRDFGYKSVEKYRSSVTQERFELETVVNPEMFYQFINEVVFEDLINYG